MFKSKLNQFLPKFKENLKSFFGFKTRENNRIEESKEKEEPISGITCGHYKTKSRKYGKSKRFDWNPVVKCFGTFSPIKKI